MLQLLREKAEQLKALGCEGFAILWDDIEPELSKEDAKHFKSFSEAHCRVSNQLHQQLGRSIFLFCPVEYCASRASPCVAESEYLRTIGDQLDPDILVFWTGSKVRTSVGNQQNWRINFLAKYLSVLERQQISTY